MKNLLVILLSLIAFQACKSTTPKENSKEVLETVVPEKPKEITAYRTLVDQLRMRKTADLKANVVYTLKEGETVTFLGEKSKHTERIKLRGEHIQAPWYKVKTESGTIGWVFGGGLVPATVDDIEGLTTKSIEKMKWKDFSDLYGLEVLEKDFYTGTYSYYLKGKTPVLHGKLKFTATEFVPDYDIDVTTEYTGTYKHGVKEGLFVQAVEGVESFWETKILFENGRCKNISLKGDAEGEHEEAEDKNPSLCEFSAIEF